ncbi:hypothetical protein [Alteribacter populi]|uniref:hypothetical protein n=1 Tax=Alteribacter populi TaxID=2011011 RepID=UPI000BBAA244|nr:hypothetical protein [Alteribacter populi]
MKKNGWAMIWVLATLVSAVMLHPVNDTSLGFWITGQPVNFGELQTTLLFPLLSIGIFTLFLGLRYFNTLSPKHIPLFQTVRNNVLFLLFGVQVILYGYANGWFTTPYVGIVFLVAWLYIIIGNQLPRLDKDYSFSTSISIKDPQKVRTMTKKLGLVFFITGLILPLIVLFPPHLHMISFSLIMVVSAFSQMMIVLKNIPPVAKANH